MPNEINATRTLCIRHAGNYPFSKKLASRKFLVCVNFEKRYFSYDPATLRNLYLSCWRWNKIDGVKNIVTKRFNFNLSLPLFIISILLLFIVFVAVFRISNLQPYSFPKQLDIKIEKEILLKIEQNGETLILDDAGNVLISYSKEQENFVSTVTKVLERDRKKVGIFENSHVFLRLKENDRLSIFDPQTEREIDLAGFGDENIQIFFKLLE